MVIRLPSSVASCRSCTTRCSSSRSVSLGVDGVGLAAAAPGGAVGRVNLHHRNLLSREVAGQARTVGAGALHPSPQHRPALGCPVEKMAVAGRGGRELRTAQQPAKVVKDGGDVHVLVGVDAEHHHARLGPGPTAWTAGKAAGMPRVVTVLLFDDVPIASAGRWSGQDCDGAFEAKAPNPL